MAKDKHELDSMTKDDLVAYADDLGVETQHSWLKEEIVSTILKGQRAAARQKQPSSKEVGMNDTAEVPEVTAVKVTGPINIKGQDYDAGDEVMLTAEEVASMTAAGCPIEGVEPLDDEGIQAAHDAGVEAQTAKLEENAEAEKKEKEEAEAKAKPKS